MAWSSMLAIYILFWAFSVFLVLPFGVTTTEEAGAEHVPGQAESAPHEFDWKRLVVRVTIVATILFGAYMLNWYQGWITPASVDLFGRMNVQVQ